VVLPIPLKAIGIDAAKPSARITYSVGVAGFYTAPGADSDVIDQIGPITYDPLKPALRVTGQGAADALVFTAKAGTALSVWRDKAAVAADKTEGLLVIDHHNATGNRAVVVPVPGA
jgi:hypothetical protein